MTIDHATTQGAGGSLGAAFEGFSFHETFKGEKPENPAPRLPPAPYRGPSRPEAPLRSAIGASCGSATPRRACVVFVIEAKPAHHAARSVAERPASPCPRRLRREAGRRQEPVHKVASLPVEHLASSSTTPPAPTNKVERLLALCASRDLDLLDFNLARLVHKRAGGHVRRCASPRSPGFPRAVASLECLDELSRARLVRSRELLEGRV